MPNTNKRRTSTKNPVLNAREKAMFEALGINPVLYPGARPDRVSLTQRKRKADKGSSKKAKSIKLDEPTLDSTLLDSDSDIDQKSHGRVLSCSTTDGSIQPTTGTTTPNEDESSVSLVSVSDIKTDSSSEAQEESYIEIDMKSEEQIITPACIHASGDSNGSNPENSFSETITLEPNISIPDFVHSSESPKIYDDAISDYFTVSTGESIPTSDSNTDPIPFINISNTKEIPDVYLDFVIECANAGVRIPPRKEFEIFGNMVCKTVREQAADIRKSTDWSVQAILELNQKTIDTQETANEAKSGVKGLDQKFKRLEDGQVNANNLSFQDNERRKMEIGLLHQHTDISIKQLRQHAESLVGQLRQAAGFEIRQLHAQLEVVQEKIVANEKNCNDTGLNDKAMQKMDAAISHKIQHQFDNYTLVVINRIDLEVDKAVTQIGKKVHDDILNNMELNLIPEVEKDMVIKFDQRLGHVRDWYEKELNCLRKDWEAEAKVRLGQIETQEKEIVGLRGELHKKTKLLEESLKMIEILKINLESMKEMVAGEHKELENLRANVDTLEKTAQDINDSRDQLTQEINSLEKKTEEMVAMMQVQQDELKKVQETDSKAEEDSFIKHFDKNLVAIRGKLLHSEESENSKKSSKMVKIREFFSIKTIMTGLRCGFGLINPFNV